MSNEPRAGMNLDPEMLAAYIDKRLTPEQRAAVEEQLAKDPDSYAVMVESMKTVDALESSSSPNVTERVPAALKGKVPPMRRWVIAVASLAAAAAIAMAIVQPDWLKRLRGIEPSLEQLVAAVGEERYVEGRLTGGFKYGPLRSAIRGSGALSEQNLALLAAAGTLQRVSEQDPSSPNLRAWGVSQALLGRFDDAVQTLEAAVAADQADAESHSDLAAVYAARATALERDDDWPRSLAAAERSLRLRPDLMEAQFNRAYALQQLHLNDAALRAWDEYLALDHSQWRAAALQLRQRIGTSSNDRLRGMLAAYLDGGPSAIDPGDLVRTDAQKARELLEDELLPRWAEAQREGPTALIWLERAEAVARQLSAAGVDNISLTTVGLIRANLAVNQESMRKGLQRWREGRALYARNEMARMTVAFQESAEQLTAAGAPLALWARHYVVVGQFYAGKLDSATQLCRQLVDVATAKGYGPLRARLIWDLGTLSYQQARFEDALAAYRDAGTEFERLGEHENAAAMEQLTAESMARLGEPLASWKHHRKALANLSQVSDPRRRHTILAAAGHSALNLGMPEAAFYLFDAAVPNAIVWNTPVPIVEALLNRARANVALDRPLEAETDLVDAGRHLNDLTDPSMKARFSGDLMLAIAESHLESDPATARRAATAALGRAETLASEYRIAALRLLEGRAALATGDIAGARASLQAGVDALESKRALVQQRALRVSFLDSVWDVYGELIRLEALSANDPATALSWVERSRGRMVLDDLGESKPSWDVNELRQGLSADEGILYVESHPKVLLEWLVTSRETIFRSKDVSREDLVRFVSRYRAALQSKNISAAAQSARQIYDLLIAPVDLRGRGLTKVAIAPDAILEAVPFSALQNEHGEYLAEWLTTSVIPSASVLRSLRSGPRTYDHMVAIGQPQLSPSLVRMLPPLPDASAEMSEIAALYPHGSVIRERDATAAAFMSALLDQDVVQFSGHALANPGLSWQARLILAPGADGDSGVLSLESLKPGSVRAHTVILAACGTGLGGQHRGEGLLTLGRPLMAAGARAVVVSLWSVDDRAMRALTTAFHRHLATGKIAPAAALRMAQRTLMMSAQPEFHAPWAWAALNLQGAFD